MQIAGCEFADLAELLHGSTIAINTVLERSGARTALITTDGFRDVYAIGRGNRPDAFNLHFHRPQPLVPRESHLRGARAHERGRRRADAARPRARSRRWRGASTGSASKRSRSASCTPTPTRRTKFLRPRSCGVSAQSSSSLLSHEILRAYREYERTSTTALNAFVGPRVARYLARFEGFAREERFAGNIAIMRSNGGTMSIDEARRMPVAMMESGPVAGMIGAGASREAPRHRARHRLRHGRHHGEDLADRRRRAADRRRLRDRRRSTPASRCSCPVVDIVEVGAGGGSIAWCDDTGALHVGPVSAGADPGPACYGRGGKAPTVTDADLVLGRLNGARFLGGGMTLDRAAAEAAIMDAVGRRLNLDVATAAYGIAAITDGAMALAVRAVSVDRGIDPRDTAIIAFGGAGALHAVGDRT